MEAQFLNHTTIDSPQCHVSISRRNGISPRQRTFEEENLTKSECNSVYDALAKYLDWIGTIILEK
jgi:hypothetical protein